MKDRFVDDDPPIKTHAASQAYRDNWDRIFGEAADEPAESDQLEFKFTLHPPDEPCDVCGAPGGAWCKPGCSERPRPE